MGKEYVGWTEGGPGEEGLSSVFPEVLEPCFAQRSCLISSFFLTLFILK